MKVSTRNGDKPSVLSVGQCGFDGANIQRILTEHFDADVTTAGDSREALNAIREKRYQLVLVNRIFDGNGESGLELIKRLQSDKEMKATPVMLVSNFADAQQSAIELGAAPGFGKNSLNAPQTTQRLALVLAKETTRNMAP